ARGHSFEFVEQLSDDLRQVSLAGLIDPALERDPEDGDPCLRSQTRGWVSDAALAQRLGHRRGKCGELDQLALLELWVRRNDGLSLSREFAAFLEQAASRLEGRGHRAEWRRGSRRAGDGAHNELLEYARAPEQDLALVSEVAEERSLRKSCPPGNL